MNDEQKSGSVERVRQALEARGAGAKIVCFDQSTRTAAEAAAAVGCEVGQIAKSLIFKSRRTERPILVIVRGNARVNEQKVADTLGEKIRRADAKFVREKTGFAIGGVAPVGHTGDVVTFIDGGLGAFDKIWAAAGTPNTVFETTLDELVLMTGVDPIEICE
ncbi:MAG: hypothetical protein CMP14_01975 [Rickettsiales bacterium]|nr:hypothetical protein [Rickettsiales bacterium]